VGLENSSNGIKLKAFWTVYCLLRHSNSKEGSQGACREKPGMWVSWRLSSRSREFFAVLLLLFVVDAARWCHRDWPAQGRWTLEPPYWETVGCPNQPFGKEATIKCLQGRTLYFIGNSVGRQGAFGIVEMLGGAGVKRENQRDACPKHETTWDDSCHREFAGVKIRYLFLQFMDGFDYTSRNGFPYYRWRDATNVWQTGRLPVGLNVSGHTVRGHGLTPAEYADGQEYWIDDNCILHNTRDCFGRFFNGSTANDVLVFTLGMSYPLQSAVDEADAAFRNVSVDTRAWLLASAASFRAHVAATFKGQVFRTTLAQLSPLGRVKHMTPLMHNTNKALWSLWAPGSEPAPWYSIDQWAINSGREHLYQDHVHFNGLLTHAMLHQVLNELCPGQGDDAVNVSWPRVDWARHVVTANHKDGTAVWFWIDGDGLRHAIEILPVLNSTDSPSFLLPRYLARFPVIEQPVSDVIKCSAHGTPMPVLADGLLIRSDSDRTVYLLDADNRACAIQNIAVFAAHGWDFGNVRVVSKLIFELLEKGPIITSRHTFS